MPGVGHINLVEVEKEMDQGVGGLSAVFAGARVQNDGKKTLSCNVPQECIRCTLFCFKAFLGSETD